MNFKLDSATIASAASLPRAGPFDPSGMGRSMGGWLLVGLESRDHWQPLAEQALRHVIAQNQPHSGS